LIQDFDGGTLVRPRHKWDDNVKTDLRFIWLRIGTGDGPL
jgi:hypothetical protein